MKRRIVLRALVLAVIGSVFAGCFGTETGMNPDQLIIDYNEESTAPFIEGYIEFLGPHEKWVGPASFVLHVSARDGEKATLNLAPSLVQGLGTVDSGKARDELLKLFVAMRAEEQEYYGCMNPVKVRLIRSDGSTAERMGCRGQAAWPRIASETVNRLLEFATGVRSIK